jgi:hypothetical protein
MLDLERVRELLIVLRTLKHLENFLDRDFVLKCRSLLEREIEIVLQLEEENENK